MMTEQNENDLYAEWLAAQPEQRSDIEAKLYPIVKRHAQAVLWNILNEPPVDLADAVAEAVITGLGRFRKECLFSTWVDEIARRKAKQHIRGKVRRRKVFDEYAFLGDGDQDDASERLGNEVNPRVLSHLDGEIAVREFLGGLPKDDAALIRHKQRGFASKEISAAMGMTVEAVDSRWARLKRKVNKILLKRRKRG